MTFRQVSQPGTKWWIQFRSYYIGGSGQSYVVYLTSAMPDDVIMCDKMSFCVCVCVCV